MSSWDLIKATFRGLRRAGKELDKIPFIIWVIVLLCVGLKP